MLSSRRFESAMALSPEALEEREERLDAVVLAYLQSQRAGQPIPRQQLLRDHPDLAADLGEFFADQDRMERVAAPLRLLAGSQPEEGQRLGDYDLLNLVAQGGMGAVYRARQRSLNRIVALKMVRAGLLAGPIERLRFQSEAQAVAALDHPNIVPVYDVGHWEGGPYFTMKFIEGGNLSHWLQGAAAKPPDWNTRAAILATVARAIHYAHQRGILHRDLKPANILIDPQGQAHVTDFGLAKRFDPAKGTGQAIIDTPNASLTPGDNGPLTQTGAIVGTPAYMAPELAAGVGGATTVQSDIYGLGAILYEMLTDRPPFKEATPLDTLLAIREKQATPPRHVRPGIPRDLETICLKCLSKEPGQRYATAQALADDLTRFVSGEPIRARRTGSLARLWSWARRKPILAALNGALILTVLGGAGLFAWQWYRAEKFAEQERQQADAAETSAREAKIQAEAADRSFHLAHNAIKDLCEKLNPSSPTDSPALKQHRRELLELALTYYHQLLDLHAKDPRRARDVAKTHYRIAVIAAALDSSEEALAAFKKALTLQKELADLLPDETEVRIDLGRMHHQLGVLQSRTSRPKEALTSFKEAEELLERLATKSPKDDALQMELAHVCEDLAVWQRNHSSPEKAQVYFEKSRDILTRVAERSPRDPHKLSRLAKVHWGLAMLHLSLDRRALSSVDFWKACRIREQLVCAAPKNLGHLRDLAECYRQLGGYATVDKKSTQALAYLEAQHAVIESILALDPGSRQTRSDIATSHRQMGHFFRGEGEYERALACYTDAMHLEQELVRLDPSVSRHQNDLAKCYFDMGTVYGGHLKKHDRACEVYAESAALRRKIVDANPDNLTYRADLAITLNNLGASLFNAGKEEEGLARVKEACTERRLLFERNPVVPDYRRTLSSSLGTLARLHRSRQQWDLALERFLERRPLWTKSAEDLVDLAKELARSAALMKADGDAALSKLRTRYLDEALATLEQAVDAGWTDHKALADKDFSLLQKRAAFQNLLQRLKM
jgi:serine/threonine protein kinase